MATNPLRSGLTLRLAGWYFALSAFGAILVVLLTHAMLAQSLRERDRDAVREVTVRYALIYEQGGLPAIEQAVAADRMTSRYEPFFLRIARGPRSVLYLMLPNDWSALDEAQLDAANLGAGGWLQLPMRDGEAPLDVSGIRLADGTELQVGKSSRIREEALARFRARAYTLLGIVFVAMFAGAVVLTHWALAPMQAMIATIERMLRTGNLRARVRGEGGPLAAAAQLFNNLLDRIERLMTGMRQILDNTAHDLRTPLTRARARVESALLRPDDAAAQAAALERTLEDIDRIDQMLTTLLDISEAESGAMRLVRTSVDAAGLLEETCSLFTDSAEARGLRVTAAAPAGLAIDGDRDRLRQVLANLVDNAIKYTPAGGHIALAAEAAGDMIDVRITDTGRGIPADELPRIWERSFRGDESRAERGYGLGLSLVKAIVDAHGGTVSAASGPGAGSTFTLRLPRAGAPPSLSPM